MTSLLYLFIMLPAVLMVAAVGCTWLAARAARHHHRPIRLELAPSHDQPAPPFAVISLNDAFEPETAPLWETQIAALQMVAAGGAAGFPLVHLRRIYAGLSARYPELYDGASFAGWLRFLEETSLLWSDDDKAYLTTSGRAFLECRVTARVTA